MYTKLLAGILCAAIFLTDFTSTGILSLAAEAKNTQETQPQAENTADTQENTAEKAEEEVDAQHITAEKAEEEADAQHKTAENTTLLSEEKTSVDTMQTQTPTTTEQHAEAPAQEDDSESTQTPNEGLPNTQLSEAESSEAELSEPVSESETEEMQSQTESSAGENIASGVIDEDYGHITWVIDADGKLTVEGTGDFAQPGDPFHLLQPWDSYDSIIKSAEIRVAGMTDASNMFFDYKSLTSLDLSGFDTSKVTDMSGMFFGCKSLTSLDLSGFDTSNVTDMSDMFGNCNSLTSLDLSNFDTSNVTDMHQMFHTDDIYMFGDDSSLTSLNLSGFDTSKVTNMSGMFWNCSRLTSLDLSGFNTSKVTDMAVMFGNCSRLTSLDLSGFDTSKVTSMGSMFDGCSNLISLDPSGFDTSKVTSMGSMFDGCSNLTSLDLSGFDTSKVTNMSEMFSGCSKLTSLNLSGFDTSKVTDMTGMFGNCSRLTSLDLSGFDTSKVTNMSEMFSECSSLSSLDLSGFDTSNVAYDMNSTFLTTGSMDNMFSGCKSLTSLDLSGFDTSKVTDMTGMFYNCSSLTSLDLTSFDTSKVTNMFEMFYNCSSLTSLDLTSFDTSKVTFMPKMFKGCSSLTSLDLTSFDTSKVTDMSGMFHNCSSLTSLDLTSFSTSKVTYMFMSEMFKGCSNLTSLVFGDFSSSGTIDTSEMFIGCSSLTSLDLSGFDASGVDENQARCLLDGCSSLETIYTPRNIKFYAPLPTAPGDKWYRSDGTQVGQLPLNLPDSIILGRNYTPVERGERLWLKSVTVQPADTPQRGRSLDAKSSASQKQSENLLISPYYICDKQGKITLNCQAKYKWEIKEYALYVGNSIIATSSDGIFRDLDPKLLAGEMLCIYTKGKKDVIKQYFYLNIVDAPQIPSALELSDGTLSFPLSDNIPILGGQTFNLLFPELPVSVAYGDGKIKVGINIPEEKLSDELSDKLKKQFENIQNSQSIKNLHKFMENKNLKASTLVESPVNFSVIGYVEAELSDTKSFKSFSGTLAVEITAEGEQHINTTIIVIPVTLSGYIAIDGSAQGTLEYDCENAKWYGDVELAVSGSIGIAPGIGWPEGVSLNLYGEIETGAKVTIPFTTKKPGLHEWYLYGEAGIKGYFVTMEVLNIPLISTKKLLISPLGKYMDDDGHLLLYSDDSPSVLGSQKSKAAAENIGPSADSLFSLNDELYQEESAEWADCTAAVALAAENADNVLVTNAYAAASPKTATIGDNTVLLYIDNDTNRAQPNQTVLKYRVYDAAAKSWGPAATACEDGTADFNPVVYSDGTDIYVIYQNSSTIYAEGDEPETDAYIGSFGISALQYDAKSQKFINLGSVSKSNCYCYAPQLAMTDKGLCAAWVENSDNSLFGQTMNNRVMTSILTDKKFSAPVTAASGLSAVTSLAIGKNRFTDSLAYAVDTDNDFTTQTQEIYLAALSNAPVKCTEGNITGLKFTSLPGVNASVLACNVDGALSYITGNFVKALTGNLFMGSTDFIVDGNRVFFLYNQDGTRNVKAAVYSNGVWNTVMVTSEKDYIDTFSYDGKRFTYLLTKAVLDDTDSSWNTSSVIKTFEGMERSGLAVYSADFEPEDIKPGAKIPVALTVVNEGLSECPGFGVTVKKSDGSEQKLAVQQTLAPGEVKECNIKFTLPDSIDASCVYTLTLDAIEGETETDNNSCRLDMSLSDCEVSASFVLEKESEDSTDAPTPILETTVSNLSYVAATGKIVIKDQDLNTIFTSDADTIDAAGEKIYRVDLTKYLPDDNTSVMFTSEFITDAEEYYKSNNSDSQTAYLPENTGNKIEAIPKGIEVSTFVTSGYEYTESGVTPTLFVYNDGELLAEGTDYTVQYENNTAVYSYSEDDAGFDAAHSPKAVVSFTGEAAGNEAVTRYFKIVPKDIGGSDVTCYDAESDENGTVQHPDIELSIDGTTLVKDRDYTLTYPSEGDEAYKEEGTYNILIKGKGNYCGSRYAAFTIRHTHVWSSSYSRDGEGHWLVCGCGEAANKEGHTYGSWTIIKQASKTESGAKERVCSVCGYTETEVIKVLDTGSPEEPSEGESSESESSESKPSAENPSESESSESSPSEENPSEDESIWGDILPEDRPASANDIPEGLWIAGVEESYSYIGEALKPEIRVYDSATLLAEKTDYTVTYKNNVIAGEALITVTGKGNYSGKETCTFRILPADISGEDCFADDFYVKINAKKAQKPVPTLYCMGKQLKYNKDFTITYSNTSGVYAQEGEYTATVTGKNNYTGTKTLTLYAVSKIPKKKPVSIKKAVLSGFEKSFNFTGKACRQTCTLKIMTDAGEKTLVEGADYTVRYTNNKKAGTATVIYYGKSGYSGTLKKTYKILPYDIAKDEAEKITYNKTITCVYAKGGAKPKPTIIFNGMKLREGADYTLKYKNNKAIGANASPCVTVNGKGSFKGKITIDFTIKPQDLSNMTLVSCDKVYKNKAGNHKIVPKLMDLDGKLLSAGKDFDKNSITYAYEADTKLEDNTVKKAGDSVGDTDIIPAGTQIRVTLNHGSGNNYTGTFTGVYHIVKADIKSAKVAIPNQTYTGKEIILDKSQITVTLSGTKLKPEDFDIILYTDNVKKGKASVTIKGNGNYGGTKTVKFTIGSKGFLWWWRKN